ncbi:hypothetical protein ACFL0L_01685 [Patescibacteria group bacterium]
MKKNTIIIIVVIVVVIIGAVLLFMQGKPCFELNEEECKTADGCVSVLVPCTGADCVSDATFKECKDK